MTRYHLVCYASGSAIHALNRDRLVASARKLGFDAIHIFGPEAIDADFRARHASILKQGEGGGYWLWKPYFIARVMDEAAEDDRIVYVDSGAYLRRHPDRLWRKAPDADVIVFENDYLNRDYVKRDAFVLMGADTPEFHDSRQLDAGFILFRNGPAARKFVGDWLSCCCDERVLTDSPNGCGLPDLPGFVGHRHDQSVLSLLYWRDRKALRHIIYPRSLKHAYIVHHRRRSPHMPIWVWHLFHDGAESLFRRMSVHGYLR